MWTKETPTKSGLYWVKTPLLPDHIETEIAIAEVDLAPRDATIHFMGWDVPYSFQEIANAEWSGPIEAPPYP